ncbi:hypothetical protein LX64_01255 [Chitinophaga skermanii]|uniref:HTH araC/xylS-type domain-containing protein n=1 Tax=Chitinophaga skermanii TaxID=331697 RepID=A0A327QYB5_9BACT|nr:helix-turn-helix domain-containing protein [Chitinophaga skermanii]RAJ08602.1 hypothetical protein LX64_01255 [Chitinophaga skermanii]
MQTTGSNRPRNSIRFYPTTDGDNTLRLNENVKEVPKKYQKLLRPFCQDYWYERYADYEVLYQEIEHNGSIICLVNFWCTNDCKMYPTVLEKFSAVNIMIEGSISVALENMVILMHQNKFNVYQVPFGQHTAALEAGCFYELIHFDYSEELLQNKTHSSYPLIQDWLTLRQKNAAGTLFQKEGFINKELREVIGKIKKSNDQLKPLSVEIYLLQVLEIALQVANHVQEEEEQDQDVLVDNKQLGMHESPTFNKTGVPIDAMIINKKHLDSILDSIINEEFIPSRSKNKSTSYYTALLENFLRRARIKEDDFIAAMINHSRAHTGCTIHGIALIIRLMAIKDMFKNKPKISKKEIVASFGLKSYPTFSKTFTEYFKISPSEL